MFDDLLKTFGRKRDPNRSNISIPHTYRPFRHTGPRGNEVLRVAREYPVVDTSGPKTRRRPIRDTEGPKRRKRSSLLDQLQTPAKATGLGDPGPAITSEPLDDPTRLGLLKGHGRKYTPDQESIYPDYTGPGWLTYGLMKLLGIGDAEGSVYNPAEERIQSFNDEIPAEERMQSFTSEIPALATPVRRNPRQQVYDRPDPVRTYDKSAVKAEPISIPEMADNIAATYDIPPDLFRRLIAAESNFNPLAESGKQARGLTQMRDIAIRDIGLDPDKVDPFDPEQSLDMGAQYLRKMYDEFGNWEDAVAAYNMGPTALRKLKKQGKSYRDYAETRKYVPKVAFKRS